MKKYFSLLFLTSSLIFCDDLNLWVSFADDNSIEVSMVSHVEFFGFQMEFGVEGDTENLFAPVDSAFYNDAGESVTSKVIYPLSGAALENGYTCFINEEGLLVAFSFENIGIPPGDTTVLFELPWIAEGITEEQVTIIEPIFVGLDGEGEPISLDVEYGLIEYQDGWPYETISQVISSPTTVHFDSGRRVLFGDYNGYFRVVNIDGSDVCWFNTGNQIWGSPAISDIDGDGDLEIIITSKSKHLYVLDDECNLELDFDSEQYLMGSPAIGNLDDDPEKEIVFGGYSNPGKLFAINHDGTAVENFPIEIDEKIQRGVALVDFNGNGKDDIVFGTDDEHIYLVFDDGSIANGFPFSAGGDFRTAPVVLDANGTKIILAGSRDNSFYALNSDGSIRFQIQTGDDIPSSAGILDTDSGPAIFFGSEDGFLYGVDIDGNSLSGWPIDTGIDVLGSPVFADLEGDGLPEIITTNGGVEFLVFHLDGSSYEPIPIEFELPFVSSPSVSDMDLDGDLELLGGTSESIVAVDIKTPGTSEGFWSMYRGNLERTGFLQATGGGIEVSYISDWNLVGLPLNVEDNSVISVFPESIEGTLFSFNESYIQQDELTPGTGYCLRFESEGTSLISGTSINSLNLELNGGWNLISGISTDIDVNMINDPGGIIIPGTIYGYNGSYVQSEMIEPGNGYWLRTLQAGSINISTTLNRGGATRNLFVDNPETNLLRFNNGTELLFGTDLSEREYISYMLPPKIPGGADIRFTGNVRAIKNHGIIEITSENDQISFFYDIKTPGESWIINNMETKEEYLLSATGNINIPGEIQILELKKNNFLEVPEKFAFHPAYPNPFNPSTAFRFDVPVTSKVKLSIYNLMGEEVRNLVKGNMQSGSHTVVWDGLNAAGYSLSAGVYLSRIESENFIKTQKLIFLK